MDKIVRLPRSMGLTNLMVAYHKSKDESILDRIHSMVISEWITCNGRVFNKDLSIIQLSNFLNCKPDRIRFQMKESFLNTKIWDKTHQEEMIESLMGQQVIWAIEDRMDIQKQVDLLRKSQGDGYRAYVTAELNKALGMRLSSTSNLQSIIRNLSGGGSVNIFNNIQNNTQNNVQSVSLEEALSIIQEENAKALIDTSKEVKFIEANYPVDEFPEVVATRQNLLEEPKDTFHINKNELNSITDNYKETLNIFNEDHHDIRREIELNIDTDENDPETDMYLAY